MNLAERNKGPKVAYSIEGTKVSFGGMLTLDLEQYEQEDARTLYICADRGGCMLIGVYPDLAYVAEIAIPARRYKARQKAVYQGNMPVVERDPAPFDMAACTLTLWALEE